MAKWLDKYEQGGLVLKQKTKDNYGKKPNPNDVKVSSGPGYVGMGNDITGRDYSPAWGGQFEYGGNVAQKGKSIPVPTTEDSLMLYKNQLLKDAFYRNNKDYVIEKLDKVAIKNINESIPSFLKSINRTFVNETLDKDQANRINEEFGTKFSLSNLRNRYKKVSDNVYSVGDIVGERGIDFYFNPKAPPLYFSDVIKPETWKTYYSEKFKDLSSIPTYNSFAIKPYHMRTDEEKLAWEKKYGKGTPITSSTKKPITSTEKSKTAPEKKKTPVVKKSEETKPTPYTPTGSKKYIVNGMEVSEEDFLGSGPTTGGSKRVIYNTPKQGTQKVLRLDGTPETDPEKIRKALATANKNDNMAMGGSLPGAVGFTYARVAGSAPANGKYTKKTKASAQNGKEMQFYQDGLDWKPNSIAQDGKAVSDNTTVKKPIVASSIVEAKKQALQNYAREAAQKEQPTLSNFDPLLNASAREQLYKETEQNKLSNQLLKGADVATDLMQLGNFVPNPIGQFVGNIGNVTGGWLDAYQAYDAYNKGDYGDAAINLASVAIPMQLGSSTFRRNSKYLQPGQPLHFLKGNKRVNYIEPFTNVKGMTNKSLMANRALLGTLGTETAYDSYQDGGAIVDPMGQWAHPGEVTIIPDTNITMEGVDYPVLGISDTGDQQMMYPGEDYQFDGDYVTEYPMMKNGGWLDKYQGGGGISPEFQALINKSNKLKSPEDKKKFEQVANAAKDKRETVKQDNRTAREKEIAQQQLLDLKMAEARGSSPFAQTLSSFTPTGSNEAAGQIAAENIGQMTPMMGATRLYTTAMDPKNNPYGIGQGNGFLANTLGTLGMIGDVFDVGSVYTPALGSAIKQSTPLKNISEKEAITPNVKSSWEPQELPGLHLSSTMEGGPISKIVEPKTGLVNVEQALGIIAKESGGASKANLIKKALGKDIPKKMDYNDFRKTVQDQLIPLDREVVKTYRSNYGIDKLGYSKLFGENRDKLLNKINDTKEEIRRLEASGESDNYLDILKSNLRFDLNQYNNVPLENQTIRLSNKDKFGRGSDAHDNPAETLGHIHFIREAETPDVLTMTQMQSDAFQGTHRSMPKSLEEAEFSLQRLENIVSQRNDVLESLKKQKEELLINKADKKIIDEIDEEIDKFTKLIEDQNAINKFNKAEVENFAQKSLLDKNHQERYLQELVDYAGKRGDINKVRVPTSETAAKVQGYRGIEAEELIKKYNEEIAKNPNYAKEITEQGTESEIKLINDVLNGKKKGMVYEPEYQTILKKYTEQPKLIKKLFGVESKIVTDSKGNSWYEFDIPNKFKGGKGEIKAFKDGGWLNKYK